MEEMKWKNSDIDRLFRAVDFSKMTNLKQRLLDDIMPRRKISLEELGERYASASDRKREIRRPERSRSAEKGLSKEGVLNNDRPMLPNM